MAKEVKTITAYPEGGALHHYDFDGENQLVVRTQEGDYLPILKQIETNDGIFTHYSVKPQLLQQWKENIQKKSTSY